MGWPWTGLIWLRTGIGDGLSKCGDPGVDGRIILKWIFERLCGGHRLD
jgi:hypothetical protein